MDKLGIINFTMPTGNFWITLISWMVQITSSVVLGIVLFTVLLKLVTLPFDYVSRASMRKNSLKMEQMRPELEKLQKQYADNKDLYNQKMMALYKKNGYSMFGACLPTILTLVIFIIALNGFSDYSRYQNKLYFYNMSCSYNNVVYAGFEIDKSENAYITRNADTGVIEIDTEKLYQAVENTNSATVTANNGTKDFIINVFKTETTNNGSTTGTLEIYTENGYVKLKADYSVNQEERVFNNVYTFELIPGALSDADVINATKSQENNNLTILIDDEAKTFEQAKALNSQLTEKDFIEDIRQQKSAEKFREENNSFLWVKNVWVTDSPLKHPVESSWETFKSTHSYSDSDIGNDYNNLIAKLEYEKNAPNGFFVLVILTAGVSLLTQIVMGNSQKAQMELQTVDGQGAQTQKIMKWMMPIMMAIFAFMYTAAFSIYIILSSLISLGITFLINFIVDRKFNKQNQQKESEMIRGRVYTPKVEEKTEVKEKEQKKTKNDKFAHENGRDFLSGSADKKHVRGRVK